MVVIQEMERNVIVSNFLMQMKYVYNVVINIKI